MRSNKLPKECDILFCLHRNLTNHCVSTIRYCLKSFFPKGDCLVAFVLLVSREIWIKFYAFILKEKETCSVYVSEAENNVK